MHDRDFYYKLTFLVIVTDICELVLPIKTHLVFLSMLLLLVKYLLLHMGFYKFDVNFNISVNFIFNSLFCLQKNVKRIDCLALPRRICLIIDFHFCIFDSLVLIEETLNSNFALCDI